MPRFYKETTKEDFLLLIKKAMEEDDFFYEGDISKDLSKINFDFENHTFYKKAENFAEYPVGYKLLGTDLHVYFVNSGGDWEFPICFIIYLGHEGKLRAYIPNKGNVYNHKEKCAYGSENKSNNYDDEELLKEYNYDLMIEDITKRIKLKV